MKKPKTLRWLKKHRITTSIIVFVLMFVLVSVSIVFIDYNNYQDGNRSLFFGTIDTYSQDQTLKFNDLNVKVTNTIGKDYSAPSAQDVALHQVCKDLPSGLESLEKGCIADDYYSKEIDYQNYQNVTVWFTYQNVSKQSLNIDAYKFRLAANTSLNNKGSCSMQQSSLLQGPTLSSCLFANLDKQYSGPISLLVTYHGVTKGITMSLPKISVTINQN